MERYFLDANIIVSGLLWEGNEGRVLELASAGVIQAVTSQYVLDEVSRVLGRLTENKITEITEMIETFSSGLSEIIQEDKGEARAYSKHVTDKKDAPVLAAAIKSESILVTGDKRLAKEARKFVKVISAKELLEILK
jgi:putative PIN family toxin of toxin-antitoxin system